jgi:predicted esterase
MDKRGNMKRILFLIILVLFVPSCAPANVPVVGRSTPVSKTTEIAPSLSLDETSTAEFKITDFTAVHSPVNGDANEYLIFGNLPVMKESEVNPVDLAVFLGRWEGYSFAPPVKKDRKLVLHIAEISGNEGKLYGWTGTNLQFPDGISEVQFRVVRGETPAIEFKLEWLDGSTQVNSFQYDKEKDILRGTTRRADEGTQTDSYELTRSRSFYVYKDYEKYLASKSITIHQYKNPEISLYSSGYMLYLPDGYRDDPQKKWPLIFFLHGAGDRGDNVLVLAKASPFMYICQNQPLQAIIAAPLLKANSAYSLFPEEFLTSSLDEILQEYPVDSKRVYLTGLSLGGEATYHLAQLRPEVFAAISPLCAFYNDLSLSGMEKIKNIPVWAFHGADDTIIKPSWGQQPVEALKKVGGNVKFTILPEHDHDVWTDTYSDPAFYTWLLDQKKP